ncbi:MAG: type I glyceraldehyde-3-phosphate dehydrogenase [Thermodesulfobacteriota bacterium]
MAVRIGLNGFGRIGRLAARYLAEDKDLELVAVNARGENAALAHLLKYDSVHHTFQGQVQANEQGFLLQGKQVQVTRQGPGEWRWADLGVDLVLETTGKFSDRESCSKHLECGAKKVVISAPGKQPDVTVVVGVNDQDLQKEHAIISNASCTTNCLAPVCMVLQQSFGLERGLMNTIHSYTMSQRILDGTHKDLRRARAAGMSMIPTTTGAAKSVGEVLPELQGKLDGMATRVPLPNVSLVDLTAELKQKAGIQEVNQALREASQGSLQDILGYSEEPLVSIDYVGSSYAGVVDSLTTNVIEDKMVKLIVWYDNEAGFTHQLLRLSKKVAALL